MHEKHARMLATGIGAIVFAAGVVFALIGQPATAPRAPATTAAPTVASAAAPRGQALFVELGCAECHSFRGIGNPSGALDQAAAELDAAAMARWITAAPEVEGELSRKAVRAKLAYRSLPREDLDALIAWLASE
jgi:mono/diheme cytochrome c family protein